MAYPVLIELDLNRLQILNPLFHLLPSDPSSPREGQYYWNTATRKIRYYDGTLWRSVTQDHGDLAGLDLDHHPQYMHVSISRTVSAVHVFDPASSSPPFILGTHAQNQRVVGLNADKLDGYDSSDFALATHTHTVSQITDWLQNVTSLSLSQFAEPAFDIQMANYKIVNLADPINPKDAANKRYVDASRAGHDYKESARLVYKAPLPSSSDPYISTFTLPPTVDGVTVAVGNRILVLTDYSLEKKYQGLYVVSSIVSGVVNITRSTDANTSSNFNSGLTVSVTSGATYRGTTWILLTEDPITINTTDLEFTQMGGPGDTNGVPAINTGYQVFYGREANDLVFRSLVQGPGIQLEYYNPPVIIDRGLPTIRISFDATTVNINSFTGVLPVNKGGTGATTASQARINLGAVGRITQVIGNGSATSFTIPHLFGNRFVNVQIIESASPYREVMAEIQRTDPNNVTILFNSPPTTNQYTALVHM